MPTLTPQRRRIGASPASCARLILTALVVFAASSAAQQAAATPDQQPSAAAKSAPEIFRGRQVGTMSDLMVKIIYPTSDAILYISTRTPTNEVEWNELQGKALMLAESANLLMSPLHAWDEERWMADAKLMLEAGEAAYEAALAKDVEALANLNDAVYQSCVVCHLHYRPCYGK
jgi:hypothetical protein